jgi:hypothetical protein
MRACTAWTLTPPRAAVSGIRSAAFVLILDALQHEKVTEGR